MDKPLITLNRSELRRAIANGDRIDGSAHWLVIHDGVARIRFGQGLFTAYDYSLRLPALFPDGSGEEQEMAENLLKDMGKREEIEQACAADVSLPTWVGEHHPDEWAEYQSNALDWLDTAVLAACNGDGHDLGDEMPWGETMDSRGESGEPIWPPYIFEWASNRVGGTI